MPGESGKLFNDPWIDPADRAAFALDFVPPDDVVAAAALGLALRRQFGRGGTAVGLARAEGLVARRPLQAAEMRVISGWFARHSRCRRAAGWGDPVSPSAGWIAWHLWGGDAARAWVENERKQWMEVLPKRSRVAAKSCR